MPTVPGNLVHNSANRITAKFVIDKVPYAFAATVSPALPAFTSKKTDLKYDKPDQLTSTRNYEGRIGPEDFQLKLNNGPSISGELNLPGTDEGMTVNGNGAWEQH